MLQTIIRAPRTAEDIALGINLAKMQNRPIGPAEVARILKHANCKYVIVGAHAANGYSGRPRATVDVDLIAQFPKKASQAIQDAFPHFKVQDTPVVTRFLDEMGEVIDVMKPSASKLWPQLLKHTTEVDVAGEAIRIPVLEGVLAAKLSSMVSPLRRITDRKQDAVDFMRIVEANQKINEPLLRELAELIYKGGGDEIMKHVTDVRAGKTLTF